MTRITLPAAALLLLWPFSATAQIAGDGPDSIGKVAHATRVADGAVRVDGSLDEEAWSRAVTLADFVQKEPVEGMPPTEPMEVRVLYDEGAIYIGARMSGRTGAIQAPLGRRDEVEGQAEHILVSFDTFHDRRTAYAFGVSATGVRLDRFYPEDDEGNFDEGFDPVWNARTAIGVDSWTAELWIPFSQLRFNDQPEQVWGLNVQRFTPTLNEMVYWAPVPRTEKGWASRFGELHGISGVRPTKRIELLPYVAGSSALTGQGNSGNPFDDGRNFGSRVGVDLKMGLGPNLTLEVTVNPDFGQVEADPAEVNLSNFETIFAEKRPFFTEGARLLNTNAPNNYFYSRRIGASPTTSVSGDYVDYPKTSTIIAAAKLTGRLASGTSLGMLAAETDSEIARISNAGSNRIDEVRVAARTTYGLVRAQQELGRAGSTVSVMATGVRRHFVPGDPLKALLAQNAFALASDSVLRLNDGEYELNSYAGMTYIEGDAAAISRVQRSPVHYLQAPDRTYARFDPTRTSMADYKAGGSFERVSGRHWLWSLSTDWEPPFFETNDIGRLTAVDGIRGNGTIRYRETIPGRWLRNYSVSISQNNEYMFSGLRLAGSVRVSTSATFLNFWTGSFSTGPTFRALDLRLTRGGPLMAVPSGWSTSASLRNRAAAQTSWSVNLSSSSDELGGSSQVVNAGLSFRPSPQWQVSVTPRYDRQVESQQFVTSIAGGRPETYNQRYIFSFIDRSTLSTEFRMGYTLRPDLNIDVYGEPFAASGHYHDFGELQAARALHLRAYGTDGSTIVRQNDGSHVVTDGGASFTLRNNDFNVRSFRSNVVLRWEWRPGSTLYLVWQQDRNVREVLSDRVGVRDVFSSLSAPGSNHFVIKTSFWLPIG